MRIFIIIIIFNNQQLEGNDCSFFYFELRACGGVERRSFVAVVIFSGALNITTTTNGKLNVLVIRMTAHSIAHMQWNCVAI